GEGKHARCYPMSNTMSIYIYLSYYSNNRPGARAAKTFEQIGLQGEAACSRPHTRCICRRSVRAARSFEVAGTFAASASGTASPIPSGGSRTLPCVGDFPLRLASQKGGRAMRV